MSPIDKTRSADCAGQCSGSGVNQTHVGHGDSVEIDLGPYMAIIKYISLNAVWASIFRVHFWPMTIDCPATSPSKRVSPKPASRIHSMHSAPL